DEYASHTIVGMCPARNDRMMIVLSKEGAKSLIAKLRPNYEVEWFEEYDGYLSDVSFNAIIEASDEGYILSGRSPDIASFLLYKVNINGNTFNRETTGRLSRVDIQDCGNLGVQDESLFGWTVVANSNSSVLSFSNRTDSSGNYRLQLNNQSYSLSLVPPSSYWESCDPVITIPGGNQPDQLVYDLKAFSVVDCPSMDVSLSTPFLRRCFINSYAVKVCNSGTVSADSVSVVVELDEQFEDVNTSIPATSVNGQMYQFNLGAMEVGACQNFSISFKVSCDADLGESHCTTARVYPDSLCNPVLPIWDESSIRASSTCASDSVRLFLDNIGDADMGNPSSYTIIRNDEFFETGDFQLDQGEQRLFSLPADGSFWRLEADQSEGHPGDDRPSVDVEGCSDDGNFSTGFLTQYPQNDGNSFIDIDCEENRGAYDPNDKMGQPRGFGDNHYIEANTNLEYRIRFQNTGTDTAFTVVVRDTLPAELDASTLVMGASSHDYIFDIRNGNILVVTYNNIMLPDSNVNEPASNGFFKFRIKQQPDLPVGTIIENQAGIYFDFNEPIITNRYFHEIAEFPLTTSIQTIGRKEEGPEVRILPNPFRNQTRIEVIGDPYPDLEFWVYDALGQRVDFQRFTGNQLNYQQNHLPKGAYIYEIRSNGQRLQSGKLMVQ
ncbi:MAG: T9SS type A sorting domain-containing protein, partial [Bacteroidota bacterium]